MTSLTARLEAVLLVTDDPVPTATLATVVEHPVPDVEAALLDTARQPLTDVTGVYSPVFGWGIVDAAAAVPSPRPPAGAPGAG